MVEKVVNNTVGGWLVWWACVTDFNDNMIL